MSWCFAIVNNKLSEIYFDKAPKGPKIWGHCYVDKETYRTKTEQRWMKEETARFRFTYRKRKYKEIKNDRKGQQLSKVS